MKLTNAETVQLQGLFNKMDREDLDRVADIFKNRQAQLTRETAAQFRVGDKVKFVTRYGQSVTGTIEKINRKTIGLKTSEGTKWKVSPSLLKVA